MPSNFDLVRPHISEDYSLATQEDDAGSGPAMAAGVPTRDVLLNIIELLFAAREDRHSVLSPVARLAIAPSAERTRALADIAAAWVANVESLPTDDASVTTLLVVFPCRTDMFACAAAMVTMLGEHARAGRYVIGLGSSADCHVTVTGPDTPQRAIFVADSAEAVEFVGALGAHVGISVDHDTLGAAMRARFLENNQREMPRVAISSGPGAGSALSSRASSVASAIGM